MVFLNRHLDWHIGLMNIVVGDKQRFLPQGDYHYQIHYQVKNAFLREEIQIC